MAEEKLSIDISEDGLQAVFKSVGPETSEADVLDCLKEAGVVHGISGEKIKNALDTARHNNRPMANVVVAEATLPKQAVPTRLEHRPPEGLNSLPSLSDLQKLLECEDRADLTEAASEVTGLAVKAGDLLAVKFVEPGEPGTNIKGEPIEQDAATDEKDNPQLQPGTGVEHSEDELEFHASSFGFAGILNGQVTVLPPVWIKPDGMEACFLNIKLLSQSAQPTPANIQETLSAAQVTTGIFKDVVNQPLKDLITTLATGIEPTQPIDATPEFSFQYESQAGKILEDGSIDFKDRNLFPSVEKDALLVECKPSTPGKAGETVTGEGVGVREPIDAELIAGENVRKGKGEQVQQLFSKMDGGASVNKVEMSTQSGKQEQYSVSVRLVAQISGNVDFASGNIDHKGNVEIKGAVLGGFLVSATGDIVISEGLEDGARIKGGGNLVVRQGIFGQKTHIEVSGTVTAKFIQDATVLADGNIEVGSYIHTATVRTKGTVTVEGAGGSGGGIIGGDTWAMAGAKTKNIGSEGNNTTVIALGTPPDTYADYVRTRKAAITTDAQLKNLLSAIGIQALKSDLIRQRIAETPIRKNEILHYVKKANDLAKSEEESLQELKSLGAKLETAARQAYLDVTDVAHSRVTMRIGRAELKLEEQLKAVKFSLDPKGEKGIVWKELSETPE